MSTWTQRVMTALWPSFLGAAVLEMLVFAWVSPADLMWNGQHVTWSNSGVYTAAFFVFWLVMAVTSGLTVALNVSGQEINQPRA
jgi:hypothetical protein